MQHLSMEDVNLVAGGGITDSQANQAIGQAIGEAYHGLSSIEGRIGSVLGLGGMIAGAMLHYKLHH